MEGIASLVINDAKQGERIDKIKEKYNISINYIRNTILSAKAYMDNDDFRFNVNVYKEIVRKNNTGIDTAALAKIYNLEELVIRQIILQKANVRFNPVKHSAIIKMLRDTDLSYREISKEIKCSTPSVNVVNNLYSIRER